MSPARLVSAAAAAAALDDDGASGLQLFLVEARRRRTSETLARRATRLNDRTIVCPAAATWLPAAAAPAPG